MTELFFSTLDKYGVVGVLAFLGLTVIVNLKNIIPFLDGYKKRRMNLLKEVLTDKDADKLIKQNIQDEIDSEYFRLAHGIKVDKEKAICILNTHKELGSKIPFRTYLNANYYIFIEDNKMKIKISKPDKLNHYYNIFTASILFISSPTIVAISTTTNTPIAILLVYLLSMVMMFISILIFASTRHYKSATIIEKELLQINSKDTDK
ncbi:hypothetical protein GCM10007978_07470 [Shewanella hanedai]|uniref:Uncharacterized protein n=1 Tax=Shewanella hanedai TaxID=25 RepID=A0A553JT83_SHEHA|nr:hypothetical protein [Shewanella hanedai]TRY15611.1 hypothetical protein FN961_03810 [Shewanella hanedai]GGI72049.1 hypothetical protein GCM10007978_07470 [Shewanella hanedai]